MGYHNYTGKNGYIYILSNSKRNVIYVGITDNLIDRVWDHRCGKGSDFTKRYNLKILLYYEKYPNINKAIEREKQLKNWHREWKMNLIKEKNPILKDLWEDLT